MTHPLRGVAPRPNFLRSENMATAGAAEPAGVALDEYTFSRGQESTANLQTKLANTLRGHECYPSECILYHYTGLEAARSICAGGFRRSPVGMAGPGVYFSTISPADALGGEGGPRWPDPAFTEQMLRNNFGDAAAEAGRLGKLDVVLVCKISRDTIKDCLLYTSPSPRDGLLSRMPSSA